EPAPAALAGSLRSFITIEIGMTGAVLQTMKVEASHLLLHSTLKKLDRFELLILDDLGYVQKSEVETSVLFELVAHRYERRSLVTAANQPFSQWDSIFPISMMTSLRKILRK
ncbi:MAG: ATP-binding protein, partial [Leptolyngbya sp. SIO4C1]|nr:ATP-binding protein [Leptolyngbya sp. SIO4C1]